MKIATWNVNGIRARHTELVAFAASERPDVLCLQELKASPEQVPERLTTLMDYRSFWHGGAVKGYAGVSLHLRRDTFPSTPSFTHPRFDNECRIVQASVGGTTFASVYVPSGGKDYDAKVAFLRAMVEWSTELTSRGEALVLCGDINVTRSDADVHPSERRPELIGQRAEERALMESLLSSGLVDTGRAVHPNADRMFTWWPLWNTARARNVGWRLDYILVSRPMAERATSHEVRREFGTSDHGPVVVELRASGG